MKTHKDLIVKSNLLKNAILSNKDLDIVMYCVAHHLVSDLNDHRSNACSGVVNGVYQALLSQGRKDLCELIDWELAEHSAFEMA